jgi:hypothetical protein
MENGERRLVFAFRLLTYRLFADRYSLSSVYFTLEVGVEKE